MTKEAAALLKRGAATLHDPGEITGSASLHLRPLWPGEALWHRAPSRSSWAILEHSGSSSSDGLLVRTRR